MSDERKDLPSPSAANWQQSVTEAVRIYMGRSGNVLDRGVTVRDLVDAGIVDAKRAGGRFAGLAKAPGLGGGTTIIGGGGGGGEADEPDLTPPPTPTGLKVTGMTTHLFIEHDAATYTQGHGHDRTILYGASYAADDALPTFAAAKMLAQFQGNVHALPVQIGTRYRVWIKWQTVDGVQSVDPAGGTNGVLGQTGLVGGVDLSDGIITAQKLAAGAVDALDKFAPGLEPVGAVTTLPSVASYTGPKLVYLVPEGKLYRLTNGAWTKEVDAADLKAGSLDATKFAAAIEPIGMATGSALPTSKSTSTIFWNGKLYRWSGGAYTAAVPVADLSGQLADAQIAAVAAGKITGTLTGDQLADSAVSLAKFAAGLRPVEVLGALPSTGNTAGRMVLLTTDGKLYRYTGGAWTAAVAAGDLAGKITTTQITDGAVTTALLAAGAVTTDVLAANAITAGKIQAGAIGTDQLAANAIVAAKIAAGAVETAAIKAGAITTAKIAADAITANEIAAGAVTASELAADSVVSGKVAAGAINTRELVASAVTANILAADSVTAAKIAADAVTANKIQAGAVVAGKLAASAIVAGDGVIQNAAITNALIANLAVDDAKVASMSVAKLLAGSLAVGQYIQSSNFVSGAGATGTGFRLTAAGVLEASNALIRGTVYVGGGSVGGIQVAANYIASSNFNQAAKTGFYLGADGTLILPGGSVTAEQLNVGSGGNLMRNSAFIAWGNGGSGVPSQIPNGWGFAQSHAEFGAMQAGRNYSVNHSIAGTHVGWLLQPNRAYDWSGGDPFSGYFQYLDTERVPVQPGQRYCASCFVMSHRCRVRLHLIFVDGGGANIGEAYTDMTPENSNWIRSLGDMQRPALFFTAPAGAASAYISLRKGATLPNAPDASSFLFYAAPMLSPATPNQTVVPPYVLGGLGTVITPAGISTPNIAALSADLGRITAGSISSPSMANGPYWPAAEAGAGMYLGPDGLLLGNANHGGLGYCHITPGGDIYTPGFRVIGRRMIVDQAEVITTLNIAGNAVTVPRLVVAGKNQDAYYRANTDNRVAEFADMRLYDYDSKGSSIYMQLTFSVNENYIDNTPPGGD